MNVAVPKLGAVAAVVMTVMLIGSTTSTQTGIPSRAVGQQMADADAGSPTFVAEELVRASVTVVYVLKGVECPSGQCVRLFRSNDDGLHFEQVNLPKEVRTQPAVTVDSFFEQAQFPTPSDGYLPVNFELYMTNDGARTWHVVSFGRKESVLTVAATSKWAYAMLSECKFACGTDELARSATGSSHWSIVSVAHASHSQPPEVAAAVGDRVWLMSGIGTGEITILVSTNEGNTFSVVWREPMINCGLYPTSERVVWLDCSGGMMGDWFRSTDGGRHFQALPIFPYHSDPFDPVNSTVAFYLPATSAQVRVTTNGGESFESRGVLPVKGAVIAAELSFATPQQGLVLVWPANELFVTTNGGHASQLVKAPRVQAGR